jgi:flagellar M-ring protein FliF
MAALLEQAKTFSNRLSTMQKVLIISAVVGVLAILGVILLTGGKSNADMAVLFKELTPEDASKITANLKEKGIEYELVDGGSTILIPKENVYESRIELAGEGLPNSGIVGYEIFDKTNLGMSEFVQKMNYQRAIEGELSRTINALEEVKSSRVHIAVPEDALFKEDQKQPTANVSLHLKPNKNISNSTVVGIQNLVASSIEGLNPENVTILDGKGRVISADPLDKASLAGLTAAQHQQQIEVEQYLSQKVQSMLDNVLGVENSSVKVTSELNFTQIEKTITDYDPEKQVARSEQQITEKSESTDSLSYPTVSMAKDQANLITNYEIPQTIEKIINEVGNIKRLTVSVLVNGENKIIEKDGVKSLQYTPKAKEEIEQLTLAVKNAVGYDPGRNDQVSVINVPFDDTYYQDLIQESIPKPWQEQPENQKLLLLVAIILLSIFFMFRLLQSKFVKERIRIALSLPQTVALDKSAAEDEEEEEPEEDLVDLGFDNEDMLLLPADIPEQLMLESTPSDQDEQFALSQEADFDSASLAAKARAELESADTPDFSEDQLLKIEMKNKIQGYIDTETEEAVKLVRVFLTQDVISMLNKQ